MTARDDHSNGVTPATRSVWSWLQPCAADALSRPVGTLATGFEPLDRVLEGGVQPEELVIVAGKPGIGKTIALMQWTRHLALHGHRVTVANYEHRELTLICQLLLVEIGESSPPQDTPEKATACRVVADVAAGRIRWAAAVADNTMVAAAAERVDAYADRIDLVTLAALGQGFDGLVDAVRPDVDVLIVDHIQKVPEGSGEFADRIASRLKSLAVERQIAVVAACPIGDHGLQARRLRLEHLRDAATVTHEADVVMVLNDKLSAVSRAHSGFDALRAKEFRRQTIFTIEKNRRGMSGVDMEFNRDFSHRRFETKGGYVSESLVDGVLVTD